MRGKQMEMHLSCMQVMLVRFKKKERRKKVYFEISKKKKLS